MTFIFTDEISRDVDLVPVLISGNQSTAYSNQKFLTLSEGNTITGVYEIRHEVHCSPFQDVLLIDNLLAVGHEEHFYLFNILSNESILRLEMNGYFGRLYYVNGIFYIADAYGLHCIDKTGHTLWSNTGLAIDGVIVNEFTDSIIIGIAELDPPGGWVDFTLDKLTGDIVA